MRLKAIILGLTLSFGSAAQAEQILSARYDDPTTRYGHAILGDDIEWGALVLKTDAGRTLRLTLPQTHVFEDVAPRIVALPGGDNVVAVVETDIQLGARLALYDENGLVAATPNIGRTHRWLAPIGAADLDGDGAIEFAYVDRPHLAKTIRIWRLEGNQLTSAGDLPGFTNHRIGEADIAGGIRDCSGTKEMIVADKNWQSIYAISWNGKTFTQSKLADHQGRKSFNDALNCN